MTIINPASAASTVDLSQVDIESALMLVQSQRASALEDQLKEQMSAVQRRNRDIETLNAMVAEIRANRPDSEDGEWLIADMGSYVSYQVEGDTSKLLDELRAKKQVLETSRSVVALANGDTDSFDDEITTIDQAIKDLEADPPASTITVPVGIAIGLYGIPGYEGGMVKQDEFDTFITTINSKIDSLNSTQQMDMLRLQSITNKRNEAFDLMTNFVKKVQDSRSSIVSNLR